MFIYTFLSLSNSFSLSHSLSFIFSPILSFISYSVSCICSCFSFSYFLILLHASALLSSRKLQIWCQVYIVTSSRKFQKMPLTFHWPTLSHMSILKPITRKRRVYDWIGLLWPIPWGWGWPNFPWSNGYVNVWTPEQSLGSVRKDKGENGFWVINQ